jgi:hypothetical protein
VLLLFLTGADFVTGLFAVAVEFAGKQLNCIIRRLGCCADHATPLYPQKLALTLKNQWQLLSHGVCLFLF